MSVLWVVFLVFVVGAIGAVLASLLVVAERYIATYGECTVDVNEGERSFRITGGGTLLDALSQQKIFIPSACGGRGTCAYCKVRVLAGGGPVGPTETPFLTENDLAEGIRLSCQVKVREDVKVQIPRELLEVKEYAARIEKITDLTYDIKEFRLRLDEPGEIEYTPGQYVQLFAPKYNSNEEVYRAYSMSGDPAEPGVVETIIRLVPGGICTTYYFEHVKEGDAVTLNGPYGEFHLSDTDRPIIFIAGGSGMAPIKCMLHHMKNTRNAREAVYYFGANTERDMFLMDEMRQFEKDIPRFRFVPVLARPERPQEWKGDTGLVTQAVQRDVKNAAEAEAYLCGSPGMIDAAIETLKKLGMTEDRIFYDKFS